MIKRFALVKSTSNNSSCNSFGDSKGHVYRNMTKVTNVINAATTNLRNRLSKILIIIKCVS